MMFIMMLCLVSALKKYDTDAARNELLGRILTLSLSRQYPSSHLLIIHPKNTHRRGKYHGTISFHLDWIGFKVTNKKICCYLYVIRLLNHFQPKWRRAVQ